MTTVDPSVKKLLKDAKKAACLAHAIVEGETTLTLTEQAFLCSSLFAVEAMSQTLIDPTLRPNLTPPDAGSTYLPVNETGFTLENYGSSLKLEVCEALEKYCVGDDDMAGQHTRRAIHVIPGFRVAAGL